MVRRLGAGGTLDFARLAVTPVRRLAARNGSAGRVRGLLLTGNALHSDVPPDAAGSGMFGWLLCMLGQDVGFPVPEGGAGELADALRAGAPRAAGSRVLTGTPVTSASPPVVAAAGVGSPTAATLRAPPRRAGRRAGARRSTASCSPGTRCRRRLPARPRPVPVGQRDGQGELGAGPARPVDGSGRPRRRDGAPRASTRTGSSTSPPTCPSAGCRSGRSCCSGR